MINFHEICNEINKEKLISNFNNYLFKVNAATLTFFLLCDYFFGMK